MTMEQFHQLNEMEKVSAIMQFGKLMAQTTENDSRIFLYRFETFYVSARYTNPGDQLTEINCFLTSARLNPYYRRLLIAVNPAEREYDTPDA